MEIGYLFLALGIVVLGASAIAALGAVAVSWARRQLALAPVPGAVGLTLTALAAVNTLVAHPCDEAGPGAVVPTPTSARPLVAVLVEEGDCFRTGVARLALVVLLAVGTSVVVRLAALADARTAPAG